MTEHEIPLFPDDRPDAAEEELVRLARGLGERHVAALDSARISAAVLPRLAAARRTDRARRVAWVSTSLAAAAALLLVVWPRGGRVAEGPVSAPEVASSQLPIAELDGVGQDELKSLLQSLDSVTVESGPSRQVHGLGELDARELRDVLDGLEG